MDTPDPVAAFETQGAAGDDIIVAFTTGSISRQQAMRKLGVGYAELLDEVSRRHLPLPRVGDIEAERMAGVIAALT
jgi:hypothetical protein